MQNSTSNGFNRLVTSPVFLISFIVVGTGITAFGAGLLAQTVGSTKGLIITASAAFVATHFAYRSLEIHLFTFLSIVIALMLVRFSPCWVAIPGAVAGLMTCLALCGVIDASNKKETAEEYRIKHETKPRDEA